MIGIGAAGARGTNGTLSPATARTRSGCTSAIDHTAFAPQSWPTNDRRSLAHARRAARHRSPHSVTTS